MNKKVNTLLFVLGATLFNILITLLSFVLLLLLYVRLLSRHITESAQAWPYVIIFIVAIVISFVVYHFALKLLMKKINIDKHFDPIFGPRKRP